MRSTVVLRLVVLDKKSSNWFQELFDRHRLFKDFVVFLENIFEKAFYILVALVVVFSARLWDNSVEDRLFVVGVFLLPLWLGLLFYVIRPAFGRKRPKADKTQNRFSYNDYSFPSMHAFASFYSVILITLIYKYLGWLYMTLLWFIALFIGVSRVVQRMHYWADIVTGALLGAVTAVAVYWGCYALFV